MAPGLILQEVSDDADLQNEPLEIKVMDYDQITYNDSIGTVFIDLNSLLSWDSVQQISGCRRSCFYPSRVSDI